ncbi:hypothetical protein RvY_17457 [Ramazzottius varieornatus]|uniref:Uncharacterized protein n=1 Tax=Ramazzottius varieornatus TaxID=947166 RepID=A0A1D1W271_RAMVA|nr:hypothetical protein RvY_17457 [Ramazzottius varieornatus]
MARCAERLPVGRCRGAEDHEQLRIAHDSSAIRQYLEEEEVRQIVIQFRVSDGFSPVPPARPSALSIRLTQRKLSWLRHVIPGSISTESFRKICFAWYKFTVEENCDIYF